MKALILVDIQHDFLPGGALAVPAGDEVIPVANALMPEYGLVVATQDWHPPDHLSFASQHADKSVGEWTVVAGLDQILWPDHCVQDSHGAKLANELNADAINHIVPKGMDRRYDSYSGFFDNAQRNATGLAELQRSKNVDEVDIIGLATDYCVKFTALDAARLGFKTNVLKAGVRGVELNAGDCERAWAEMISGGVHIR